MTGTAPVTASFEEVLGLGDDALIAAQRLSEWCSRAPEMEEDIALANIALDQLGAARLLLTYAGELEGAGRDEDALAYLRDDREFRNVLLVELPNGDFAVTMAKLLFLSACQVHRYRALAEGPDERLAGIAAKAVKECTYHFEHAALWTVRLGDGTEESHARMQRAVDEIWPYTHELCEPVVDPDPRPPFGLAAPTGAARSDAGAAGSADGAARPAGADAELRAKWLATVEPVLAEATLTVPQDGAYIPRGGRQGLHTEHLSYLLAEMQVLHRAHPGARW
ncbi:MAG: 1,2-phenylacetyl-CoA epoxidase subunit PaaC [Micromonosporaceae bacterium]